MRLTSVIPYMCTYTYTYIALHIGIYTHIKATLYRIIIHFLFTQNMPEITDIKTT